MASIAMNKHLAAIVLDGVSMMISHRVLHPPSHRDEYPPSCLFDDHIPLPLRVLWEHHDSSQEPMLWW